MSGRSEETLVMRARSKSVVNASPAIGEPSTSSPIFFLLTQPTSSSGETYPDSSAKIGQCSARAIRLDSSVGREGKRECGNTAQHGSDSYYNPATGILSCCAEGRHSTRALRYELEEARNSIYATDCLQATHGDMDRSLDTVDHRAEPNEHSVSSGVASIGSSLLSLESIGNMELKADDGKHKHTILESRDTWTERTDDETARRASCWRFGDGRNNAQGMSASGDNQHHRACVYCNSAAQLYLQSRHSRNQTTQTEATWTCASTKTTEKRKTLSLTEKLLIMADQDRRESGYSSPSSQSPSPRSPDCLRGDFDSPTSPVRSSTLAKTHRVDAKQEEFLDWIKKSRYDPSKEDLLHEVKKSWHSRSEVSTENEGVSWTPIQERHQQKPLKGVLKNKRFEGQESCDENSSSTSSRSGFTNEEMRSRLAHRAPPFANVIEKARQCLDNNNIPRKLKAHLKHRSRSLVSRREIETANSPLQSDSNVEALPSLHRAAAEGDLHTALRILKQSPGLIQSKDAHGWPALHHALLAGHLRTACFLVEAGSDVTAYTKKRVSEYNGIVGSLSKARSQNNVSDV